MYYFDIFEALHSHKVRYLIIGGLAVNLYGVPRVTQDIDLIISTEKSNILALVSILKDLGYIPRLPVDPRDLADPKIVKEWTENEKMNTFSFYHKKDNFKVVDIVLIHPLDFNLAFKNKTVKKVKDIKIFLASIDDLIKTKKKSGRPQDLSDIEMLKKLCRLMEEKK